MHAFVFGAKRAFHSFLRVMRKPMRLWPGLTGARFDLMSAFIESDCQRPTVFSRRQSDLRRRLGVCASVVSRMLRALEKLGWVERWYEFLDRRTWRWALTDRGMQVIREARRLLLRPAARLIDDGICGLAPRDSNLLWAKRLEATDAVNGVRFKLGDRATLAYPWWLTPFDH